MADVLRYTAFTDDPAGGNPAGVVLDASDLDAAAMLAIAAEVGYSETGFITRDLGDLRLLELVAPPASVTIHQGDDMGRPSLLRVDIPAGESTGIRVSGSAVPLTR